jgi:putative ABC transport system substrate-binding protein
MRRRAFIAGLGGAAAWPLTAKAQQPERMRRIGVLMPFAESDPETQPRVTALRQGLSQLGWNEGRNLQIADRYHTPDCGGAPTT